MISGDYDYAVAGNMRETALIEFTVYSGKLNSGSGARRLIASLTDERLAADGEGNFVVRLARDGEGPNVLRLDQDASSLVVRRYLRDPRKDKPRPLAIRRTSGNPVLPELAPEWRFGNSVFASSYRTPPGDDGYVRLVMAEADPRLSGVQWLETLGHNEGAMALRLARYTGPMPEVRCRLVSLGSTAGRAPSRTIAGA